MKHITFISITGFLIFSFSYTFSQIPTDSLVAFYPFNGNANDESGNGNNGTVYGATLTADRFGCTDSAYYFGGDDFIDVPDNSTLDITGSLTLALWYKHQGKVYDWAKLISKGWDTTEDPWICYGLSLNDQDELNQSVAAIFNLSAGAQTYCGSSTVFKPGEWYHICAVFDTSSDLSTVYVNGIIENQCPIGNDTIGVTNANLQIGNDPTTGQGIVGSIDEVRIYSRALTDLEVESIYFEEYHILLTISMISPEGSCGFTNSEEVIIEIVNRGLDPISDFDVGYTLNDVPITPETVTDIILPGDTLEYTFNTKADLYSNEYYNDYKLLWRLH